MALLSELVRTVAAVEGLDEVSVGIFARYAREAGYLSQGGRGRSAAKMTIRDAANLLIAVNGCALAKEVAEAIPVYRNLKANQQNECREFHICRPGACFGDDLERTIEMFSTNPMRVELAGMIPAIVRFHRPAIEAAISINTIEDGVSSGQYAFYKNSASTSNKTIGDRSDETAITYRTLIAVAETL